MKVMVEGRGFSQKVMGKIHRKEGGIPRKEGECPGRGEKCLGRGMGKSGKWDDKCPKKLGGGISRK